MADVSPSLLSALLGAQPQQPDEVLDMVNRAQRVEEFRKQFGATPENYSAFSNFAERAPQALYGFGPPGHYSETMPLPVQYQKKAAPAPASGGEDVEAVKTLQRTLKEKGYYKGPIDGRMEGGTSAAKKEFDANEALRSQQETERLKAEAAGKASDAATAAAKASSEADARKAQQREAGNKRLQQMEAETSPLSRALRDYSTPVGVIGGLVLGALTRVGAVKGSDYFSARRAAAGDATMANAPAGSPPVVPADVNPRASAVNDFWRKGQSSPFLGGAPETPYKVTPDVAPGIRANPEAPPAAALYQPNKLVNALTDTAIPGAFLAESAASHYLLAEPAKKELEEANKAAAADPSEVNLRRLRAALDNEAISRGLVNFGRMGAAGYGTTALKSQRNPAAPAQSATAEAEQLAVNDFLRAQAGNPSPGGSPQPLPPGVRLDKNGRYYDAHTGQKINSRYFEQPK